MDGTAQRIRDAPVSPESERLQALGTFICSCDRPLLAAAGLHRAMGGGTFESRVCGGSMGAAIPDGARIRVVATGRSERGEIVAFVAAGKTFVHRVRWRARLARGWMITQGDAVLLPDPPVDRQAVLGQVQAVQSDAAWQPPPEPEPLPRRDRALSLLVLLACVVLLELHPRSAQRLIGWLRAAESRRGW